MRVWVPPEDSDFGQEGGVDQIEPAPVAAGAHAAESAPADQHATSIFYYYDLRTGQVLEGPKGSWQHRLGPYHSPYEAGRALHIARERNAEWERQEKAWR